MRQELNIRISCGIILGFDFSYIFNLEFQVRVSFMHISPSRSSIPS